ncbi:Plasma membrane t-SNARE, secretory vesicle fusion [Xylographa bjoerkii]|nr:Plasma membrane t-SNARE, secretory vesicle fusion [Xylographa bjoerkii]
MAQYGGYGNQSGYGQTNNRYDQPAGDSYGQQSANPYGQPAANPYGQQATNPYGQQSGNPYGAAQSTNPYSQTQPDNPYATPSGAPYDEEQSELPTEMVFPYLLSFTLGMAGRNNNSNIPMNNLNGGSGAYGQQQQRDPRQILNDCRDLNQAVDKLGRNLVDIQRLQTQALNDPDSSQNSQTKRQLASLSSEFQSMYTNFVTRLNKIKSLPGADQPGNKSHIKITKDKLYEAVNNFRAADSEYQSKIVEQLSRQYRIVCPDASEDDVKAAVKVNTGVEVFRNALMSDRRGQSQSTLRAVEGRHETIRQLEQQVADLGILFTRMDEEIQIQQDKVEKIQASAETVNDNVNQGNQQLDGAVTKARAANRKKWWCLGIAILIILVIVIIVVVVVEVLKNK